MGKFGAVRSVASKVSKVVSVGQKVANVSSSISSIPSMPDVNSMLGNIPGMPNANDILSKLPDFSSVKDVMDKVESIKTGPVADIMKVHDALMDTPPVKTINKAVDSINAKKEDLLNQAKGTLTNAVMSSGIKDSPVVKDAVSKIKTDLSGQGIDVDEYVNMYKDAQDVQG